MGYIFGFEINDKILTVVEMISLDFSEETEQPVTEWKFFDVSAFDKEEFNKGIMLGAKEEYDIEINNIDVCYQVFFIPIWAPMLEILCQDYSSHKRKYNENEYKTLKYGHQN